MGENNSLNVRIIKCITVIDCKDHQSLSCLVKGATYSQYMAQVFCKVEVLAGWQQAALVP